MLIQEIRARQAASEAGIEVKSLVVVHREDPLTCLNNVSYHLLFPRFFMRYGFVARTHRWGFTGKPTAQRYRFMQAMKVNYGEGDVEWSMRGRHSTKGNDESYFRQLGRSTFTACPDGDFIWTYRFFEAILCRSIPVVEHSCPLYAGFQYLTLGDRLIVEPGVVEHNLKQMARYML